MGNSFMDAQNQCCANNKSFTNKMIKVFDRSFTAHQMAGLILKLLQGSHYVFDYDILYITSLMWLRWPGSYCCLSTCAVRSIKRYGISMRITVPSPLQNLLNLSGRMDFHKHLRQWKGNQDTNIVQPLTPLCPSETPAKHILADRICSSPETCCYCDQSG